jgi:hypothetical protein
MLDIKRHLSDRGRWISCALLLLSLLILTACAAVDPLSETPLSTASVLLPLVEKASDEEDTPADTGPLQPEENLSPAPTALASPGLAEPSSSEIDCTSPATLTPSQTEGPYYTPNTPERTSLLEAGMDGIRLTLTGYVLTQDCQPVPGAWLDFWQADDQGVYDNQGYRLRGHQFTDINGRYQLETILPGEYPGRPPHIHVKVQAPGGPVLTTQLYFPASAGNQNDPFFTTAMLLELQESDNGYVSVFNFIIEK